jgi:hypothetical protein
MNRETDRIFFGLAAVAAGVLGLLQYFGLIDSLAGPIWALFFIGFGGVFLAFFARSRHWWAIIPGVILITVGLVIALGELGLAAWGGPLMLAGVGAAFVGVLLARPEAWWAIIPAGTLFSLSALVVLEEHTAMAHPEAMLFLGLGATFALLALVRVGERRMRWALIPAGLLALFGLAMAFGRAELFNLVWPLALIGGGIYVALRGRGSPPVSPEH